mmetsp:Transcript_39261/g.77208  ORF Transcript_39261/g.77208 Transcript_39261/m.77208 type:complete len:697 (+) Transcript_39261:50-2140(+)
MKFTTVVLGLASLSGAVAERRQLINRGVPVNPAAYPFVADIRLNGVTHCTGSLIDETGTGNEQRSILTAAQCLDAVNLSQLSVHMGAIGSEQGTRFAVSKAAVHPMYNKESKTYDLAILTLASIPTPTDVVQGVKLDYSPPAAGTKITYVGWGDASESGDEPKDIRVAGPNTRARHEFSVLSFSHDKCRKHMANLGLDYPQCAAFCVHQVSSGGPCKGDTGGPNLITHQTEAGWQLSGVTSSFLNVCGIRNAVSTATSLAGASKWLDCVRSGAEDCSSTGSDADCIDQNVSAKTCSDLGWKTSSAVPGVCASSFVDGSQCAVAATYRRAFEICRSQGARLCRVQELHKNVAAGTGCKLDRQRVWTRSSCGQGNDKLERMTAGGSTLAGIQPQCTLSDQFFGVRCCADQNGDEDRADLPLNIRTQKDKSSYSCRQLGWHYTSPNSNVCSTSFKGKCSLPVSYATAQLQCTSAGGRLCTAKELLSDAAAGTGCGLDMKLVWTSDRCSNKWLVRQGAVATAGARRGVDHHRSSCQPISARKANVRCCADRVASLTRSGLLARSAPPNGLADRTHCQQLLGWERGYTMSKDGKFCAKSKFGPDGSCGPAVSYVTAKKLCAADGAHICTSAELAADAAAGSGCGLDTVSVWAGDECAVPATSRPFNLGMVAGGSSAVSVTPQCRPAGSFYELHYFRCCGTN